MKARKARAIVIVLGLTVLGLGGVLALNWETVYFRWHGWRIVRMPQGTMIEPSNKALNSRGQAAVTIWSEDGPRAARWSADTGEAVLLGGPAGSDLKSMALDIAEDGTVVGFLSGRTERPFIWTERAGIVEIGSSFFLTGVNSQGQVVGSLVLSWAKKDIHPALWTRGGGVQELKFSGKALLMSSAVAINEKGWVVGGDLAGFTFLWKPEEGMKELGLPPGSSSATQCALNNQGVVLVTAERPSSVPRIAPYLWTEDGGWRELPVPAGYDRVRGCGLNEEGMVLLNASLGQTPKPSVFLDLREPADGYLIRGDRLVKLPSLPGWRYVRYASLNDRGWVAGICARQEDPKRNECHGFVLIPVR